MQTVLITGGTGLTGRALTSALLQKGYMVIILTRNIPEKKPQNGLSYAEWDINDQTINVEAIQRSDFIIHLAGAGVVEKKWTDAYKKEIVNSRTKSSELLFSALKNNPNKVKAVISASAIGWYGADPYETNDTRGLEQGFTETAIPDKKFLGETCRLWEESIEQVATLDIRLVKFRMGIVLSNDGGALTEFKKTLRFGIAAVLGNGKQVISWIHIDDLCRLFIYAIENEKINGIYNAVSPMPVSNKMLTLSLAAVMRGKFFITVFVPAFILKLMMGQRSIEVLKSAKVSCKKIQDTGFNFFYPSIDNALQHLIKK